MKRVSKISLKKSLALIISVSIGFLAGVLVGWLVWGKARPIEARTIHTTWGEWVDTSECVAIECDSSEGTKTQERVCELGGEGHECSLGYTIPAHWDEVEGTCPFNYHWQNFGNWNQRCHRNYNWMHPEHVAPIACPEGYDKTIDHGCAKLIEEVVVPADIETREISCVAEIVACEQEEEEQEEPQEEEQQEEVVRNETSSTPSSASPPACQIVAPVKIPNIFVTGAGVGQLEVRWIPTGGSKAHIFYGEEAGNPAYSLINTDNDGTEIVGGLNSGTHYWFAVTNGDDCAWSPLSDWYDPIVE